MTESSLTRLRVFAVTATIAAAVVVAQGIARRVSIFGIALSLVLPLAATWWWSDETRRLILWLTSKVFKRQRDETTSGEQR